MIPIGVSALTPPRHLTQHHERHEPVGRQVTPQRVPHVPEYAREEVIPTEHLILDREPQLHRNEVVQFVPRVGVDLVLDVIHDLHRRVYHGVHDAMMAVGIVGIVVVVVVIVVVLPLLLADGRQ